jgi:hypothetical protein
MRVISNISRSFISTEGSSTETLLDPMIIQWGAGAGVLSNIARQLEVHLEAPCGSLLKATPRRSGGLALVVPAPPEVHIESFFWSLRTLPVSGSSWWLFFYWDNTTWLSYAHLTAPERLQRWFVDNVPGTGSPSWMDPCYGWCARLCMRVFLIEVRM